MDDQETAELGRLIRRLVEDWGMGVVLIKHHVEMVMSVCDQIHVLNFGKEIASGPPSEVRADSKVIDAYLGTESSGAAPESAVASEHSSRSGS